jgi:Transposase IS116/IS110/IS902 family/Beta-lactamase superfamily domain
VAGFGRTDRPAPRVDGTGCRISYVGHASFLLHTAGLNVLLDPVWSPRASPFRHVGPKRVNAPGIAFADLPPIDLMLVTHAHYDHLDVVTLSRLATSRRPLGKDTIMRNHDPAKARWSDIDLNRGIWTFLRCTVPGIGPIISSAMVAAIGSGAAFARGRDFSAWIGLVPKQMSTGDRTILGRISKRGNSYLRTLFMQAARVILLRPASWPKHGFEVWFARAAQRLPFGAIFPFTLFRPTTSLSTLRRFKPDELNDLDCWRRAQPNPPTRGGALKTLAFIAMRRAAHDNREDERARK